jgi:hypothetical protein
MSDRFERIAAQVVAGGMAQGWYESKRTGFMMLWTKMAAYDESINFTEAEDLRKRAIRATESAVKILGKKIQMMSAHVTVEGRKPAIVVRAAIMALVSEMVDLKEGTP